MRWLMKWSGKLRDLRNVSGEHDGVYFGVFLPLGFFYIAILPWLMLALQTQGGSIWLLLLTWFFSLQGLAIGIMAAWMANIPQKVPPDRPERPSRPLSMFALMTGRSTSEIARWHTRRLAVAYVWLVFIEGVSGIMAGFANLYYYISVTNHTAFIPALSKINAAYFTIGTLSTAGTGRISAVSGGAQLALIAQMSVDVILFVVTLGFVVARLLVLRPDFGD